MLLSMLLKEGKGSTIVMVSMVLAIAILLSVFYFQLACNTNSISTLYRHHVQAYYVAEAGIEMVVSRLSQNPNWNVWSSDFFGGKEFAGGKIQIVSVSTKDMVNFNIQVVGEYMGAKRTLTAEVKIVHKQPDSVDIKINKWKELYGIF